jgi:hypothetical protein
MIFSPLFLQNSIQVTVIFIQQRAYMYLLQIYQDRLYDLLTDGKMQRPLVVREGISDINKDGVVVPSNNNNNNNSSSNNNISSIGNSSNSNNKVYESGVYVPGLSQFRVSSVGEVLGLLSRGAHNRAIRSTEYNLHSSRSHALLQLFVEVEAVVVEKNSSNAAATCSGILEDSLEEEESQEDNKSRQSSDLVVTELRRAKLTLVDLAGNAHQHIY